MSLRFALLSAAFAAALLGLSPASAISAEHTVKMLNDNGKGEFMVFEPSFVQAAPGDTIKFVATDQFHNAETLPEIWPEGAPTFRGEVSKDVTLTVEKEGVYGVKCLPHYPMGIMALVVVGKSVNADQVKAYHRRSSGRSGSRRSPRKSRKRSCCTPIGLSCPRRRAPSKHPWGLAY